MKTEQTAIIVNDRGEVFIGWRMTWSVAVNGWEDYFRVPAFGTPKTITFKENDLLPMGKKPGDSMTFNSPYVFSSVRSAERTLKRIHGHGKLAAVVT
jgi:hypothetical protein